MPLPDRGQEQIQAILDVIEAEQGQPAAPVLPRLGANDNLHPAFKPNWWTVGFAIAFIAALVILLVRAALAGEAATGTAVAAGTPPALEQSLYHYRALVTEVYDGDTVTVDLDLGFHVWKRGEKIRLADIDAPELQGETKVEGKAAGDFLRELVLNKRVAAPTSKRSSAGISA